MNKAFVREPDDDGVGRCPRCGSIGVAVAAETLSAHLPPEWVEKLSDTAFYCVYPRCEVAYFDLFERTVGIEHLLGPAYPKDPTGPLCCCFGLTLDDVALDIQEGGVQRVRAIVERSRTAEARCLTAAPDGRCCVAEVQRYYLRLRSSESAS